MHLLNAKSRSKIGCVSKPLNIDKNFDHQMSLSKRKFILILKQLLTFLKRAVPLAEHIKNVCPLNVDILR